MTPPRILVIGTSLDPNSNSQKLARAATDELNARHIDVDYLDLREHPLPMCGDEASWGHSNRDRLLAAVDRASHLLITVPIYNYAVGASAKNLLELIPGDRLAGRVVGLACAAGGANSYMSVMPYINSLMLDFRVWVAPRFVYATGQDFDQGRLTSPAIAERLNQLLDDLVKGPGR